MFVLSLQIAEPVAAAKLVDKGSFSYPGDFKYSWKTYQIGTSYMKVNMHLYDYETKQSSTYNFILKKVSKSKLKMTYSISGKLNGDSYTYTLTHTEYTKLTAARYYWRVIRPGIVSASADIFS